MGPPRHDVVQEPHQHLLSYHRLRKANLRNSIGTHLTNFTSPLLQLQLPLVSLLPCVLIQLTREGTSEVDAEGGNGKTARFTCSSKEGSLWDATRGRASWILVLRVSHMCTENASGLIVHFQAGCARENLWATRLTSQG